MGAAIVTPIVLVVSCHIGAVGDEAQTAFVQRIALSTAPQQKGRGRCRHSMMKDRCTTERQFSSTARLLI
jgi:hypothetical protein